MKHSLKLILAASAVCMSGFALAADKSNWGAGADDATFKAMLKSGFREKGIAKLTRLDQDATQAFCSDPVLVASKEGPAIAAKLEAENLKTVKWPSDGKWLGKIRGNNEEALRYAWAKIYNAKASNACSNMPRAGHMGIINEKQIKDLMALLFDPASPVNQ